MSVKFQITVNLEDLRELQKQFEQSPRSIMASIAEQLVAGVKRKMAAIAPGLAAATLEIRRRHGITSTQPLVATGHLLGSIRPSVTAFSAAALASWPAAALQKGFAESSASAFPGKTVPARPFVYLDDAEKQMAMDRIEELYLGH